jgi:hypothetical protein
MAVRPGVRHDDELDPGFLIAIADLIHRHQDAALHQTGFRSINSPKKTSCVPARPGRQLEACSP